MQMYTDRVHKIRQDEDEDEIRATTTLHKKGINQMIYKKNGGENQTRQLTSPKCVDKYRIGPGCAGKRVPTPARGTRQ